MQAKRRAKKHAGCKTSVARVYKDINPERGEDYFNYETYEITWQDSKWFSVIQKIARGKYSEVFEGHDSRDPSCLGPDSVDREDPTGEGRPCVIKVLKPVRASKIRREIKVLRNLAGGPNIVELWGVCKAKPAYGALVFERIGGVDAFGNKEFGKTKKTMLSFSDHETRFYFYQLAKALNFCHSRGIMHRDLKPGNVVIDKSQKVLKLIDWGLADFYHPKQTYNVRVASRHYKSPELLIKMQMYDYSVDIFPFGLTILGVVLQKFPYFRGADNVDQLYKLAEIFGTIDLKKYIANYELQPHRDFNRLLAKDTQRVVLQSLKLKGDSKTRQRMEQYKNDVWGLLDKLLLYEHQDRLTAKEILLHPYFKEIREKDPDWINKIEPFNNLPSTSSQKAASGYGNVPMRGQQVDGSKAERKMETG